MELMTLDSQFQPVDLVENYKSLIWSERYSSNGDFELESEDVYSTIRALPKWTPERPSYVTLRETTVPMVVEDHLINKSSPNAPSIKVTGRSVETMLERRGSTNANVLAGAAAALWSIDAAKESDAAYLAMRTIIGDQARLQNGSQILAALAPVIPEDAISEMDLTLPADFVVSTAKKFEIKRGDLYSVVMELINANHHGLKAVRPEPDVSGRVGIEIYNGADLTTGPEAVVFDARFDQFDNATYLLSERGSTNVGYVLAGGGSTVVLKNEAAPVPTGLARRVLLVDETGEGSLNTDALRRSRGLVELYKYNATALFDGEIAQQVATGYNTRYFLGDILRLTGEYDLSQDVRVAEFIRTSDSTGEKAYPTFEAVS